MLCGWDLWVIITIIFNSDYTPHITGLNSFHWIEMGNHCLLTEIIKKIMHYPSESIITSLIYLLILFKKNSIITGMRDIY